MEVVGVEKLQEVSKLVCFLCCLRANSIGIWMKSTCFFCFACTSSSSSSSSRCHGGCWCGEIFASLEFGMFLSLCANIQIWRRLVISCFACASFSSRHGDCWCGEIAGVDLVYMLLCFLANIGVRKKSTHGFWALLVLLLLLLKLENGCREFARTSRIWYVFFP
jgi:hypothetical protein